MNVEIVRMLPIAALALAAFSQPATAELPHTALDGTVSQANEVLEASVRPHPPVAFEDVEHASVECEEDDPLCEITCESGFDEGLEVEVDPRERIVVPGPGLLDGNVVLVGHYTICMPW